ncbi:MAG: serine acetyltransferase [Paludibacteraceae bacterium]|jgi:serine O-acetyltransferase|nr:serine acetyltransferase [Paludibacteraceae bacterium]MBO5988459.1 serine acetyltransferase [Paludibacteraceae bacterium]
MLVVDKLSEYDSFKSVYHENRDGEPFPSGLALRQIVDLCRSILFPGYFGNPMVDRRTIKYHIGVNVERLQALLEEQVLAGLCFGCTDEERSLADKKAESKQVVSVFVEFLPELRRVLMTDIEAAYYGDPAAKSFAEIILCYPAVRAISNHRIAHKLLEQGVPMIPRMISEMAHSETGIDIHPGATIGERFSIDHGTGVVIGETAIIGDNVKIYQGVTLGAKSFELDEFGNPVKDVPRHPILEDDVIVYANATILGRVTIGKGAVIGGNIWVTSDVEPGAKVVQSKVNR